MKKSILLLATIAVLAASLSLTTDAASQVYDLNADWSDTQNPNGSWSYREGDSLLTSDPLPWVGADYDCNSGGCALFGAPALAKVGGEADPYGPWLNVGYQNLQEGDVLFVPGVGARGNILWTAPANGTIDIAGVTWWAEDFLCFFDDGILTSWTLTHNGTVLTSGDIPVPPCAGNTRENPHDFSAGTGGAAALQNISVFAGDQIILAFSGGDKFGVNLTITLTPESVDPVAAIENLALMVVEMNLQNGIENSLDSKLDAALNALDDLNTNNDDAACNSLQAFINAVEAQRGDKLTSAQADQLIASAQQIQALLNCGN